VIPPRQKSIFARFPMRCPVESLYLLHMMRSRTKSFLCTGVCLVYCSGGVVSLVSPDGAPPLGVFALLNLWMVPEVVVLALGLVGTLPELEVAFHAPPRLLVVPCTRFRPG